MPTLGQTLKAAREERKLTPSEVAAGTHIKVQHIESIERDDFSRIAAAAYAKGFIKLYAEFLDLDPAPMLEEYTAQHAPPPPSGVPPSAALQAPPAEEGEGEKPQAAAPAWREALRGTSWSRVALGGAALVLVVFLLSALSGGVRRLLPDRAGTETGAEASSNLSIIREPPEPYLDAIDRESPSS
jgi:cytoskeletal protein RodZ